MLRLLTLLVVTSLTLFAFNNNIDEKTLKQQLGNMLVVGFDQSELNEQSAIIQEIQEYHLGGVILFNRFYTDRKRVKNIASKQQLQKLTKRLKQASASLLIATDQEGGYVERLKAEDGFMHTPSAQEIATMTKKEAYKTYEGLSKELKQSGINTNFAPVVDLALNPNNKVIYQLKRSYGKTTQNVVSYASVFMKALKEKGIISVLKHFPGHGSSLEDSHKGFVDVTHTWSKKELAPYKELIAQHDVPMIMTAHVFNANLDANYPATLSHRVNTILLRETLGFKGVVISDDLQMKAIRAHYDLSETLRLAVNSGVDMLLLGNQLSHDDVETLVNTLYKEVVEGRVAYERIVQANERINALKQRFIAQ